MKLEKSEAFVTVDTALRERERNGEYGERAKAKKTTSRKRYQIRNHTMIWPHNKKNEKIK